MFAFWRYTLLVFVGLSSLMVMFFSLAITGTLIVNAGEINSAYNPDTPLWIIGLTAIGACFWLSNNFIRSVPFVAFRWVNNHKDELTAYSVITIIFLVFMVS